MGKMSPTAQRHHCPSSQSYLEGTQGTKIVHGHGRGTAVPASKLNPLHCFLPPPDQAYDAIFFKLNLAQGGCV